MGEGEQQEEPEEVHGECCVWPLLRLVLTKLNAVVRAIRTRLRTRFRKDSIRTFSRMMAVRFILMRLGTLLNLSF